MDDARTGDELLADAFARLAPAVRAVGWRIVGPAGADDVVQETFERVWTRAETFDPARGTLDAWVLRIARNAALGQLRRMRWQVGLPAVEPPDPDDGPETHAERGEVRAQVRGAVAALPIERRAAVNEVLDGHTLVQTADRLGVPEGTVKSRVRAAYAELRESLASLATA